MKMVCVFSICALLFVAFQVADSVICPTGDLTDKKFVNCTACASYNCYNTTLPNYGCPEDAIKTCTTQTKGIENIQANGLYNTTYHDEEGFTFVSGCGNEENGTLCIFAKAGDFERVINPPKTSTVEPEKTTSASNNKNGALKLVGILGIGWMLFTAAWNY